MDPARYEIVIKRYAILRALERGITADMVEATIKSGRMERFGKNNVKFVKGYKRFSVVCVDEIVGNKLKIVTIERRE